MVILCRKNIYLAKKFTALGGDCMTVFGMDFRDITVFSFGMLTAGISISIVLFIGEKRNWFKNRK